MEKRKRGDCSVTEVGTLPTGFIISPDPAEGAGKPWPFQTITWISRGEWVRTSWLERGWAKVIIWHKLTHINWLQQHHARSSTNVASLRRVGFLEIPVKTGFNTKGLALARVIPPTLMHACVCILLG